MIAMLREIDNMAILIIVPEIPVVEDLEIRRAI